MHINREEIIKQKSGKILQKSKIKQNIYKSCLSLMQCLRESNDYF